jgi:Xaa-Pro aminopeptidase
LAQRNKSSEIRRGNLKNSLELLHERLKRMGVDAILFTTSEITPSINLRYLSGFTGSDAAILLTATERHFFTDGRYKTQVKEQTSGFNIHVERGKIDALARVIKKAHVRRVAVESPRISYYFVGELVRKSGVEIVPISLEFLESFRIRKTPEEKALISKAAQIASTACRELISKGLAGKKENDLATELEMLFHRNGAEGLAFETIVASGPRSALPHGNPTDKIVGPDELVIIDYGARVSGYRSDETVTCKTGKPSAEDKKIHHAVYEAHNRALEAAKIGAKVRDVDAVARQSIDKSGFGEYFIHGLGHGLGLETHEPPSLSPKGKGILKEGMVFTIEPGIYIENVGGVRLESLVYLGAGGVEVLSKMPKDLIRTS